MTLYSKEIVKDDAHLIEKINEIIKRCWKFVRKDINDVLISSLEKFSHQIEVNESRASNYSIALTNMLNSFGVNDFYLKCFEVYPRIDVNMSRRTGLSHSGRNILLIAFRRFEQGHIEIDYDIFTEWYY